MESPTTQENQETSEKELPPQKIIRLSKKAFQRIKNILVKELGDNVKLFSDEDIEKLGFRLLKLTILAVKNNNRLNS